MWSRCSNGIPGLGQLFSLILRLAHMTLRGVSAFFDSHMSQPATLNKWIGK